MFGTTGIRKIFSTYDRKEHTFTPSMAVRLGIAIGTYVKSGKVVIGRDMRTTALPIQLALTSGLVSTGSHVVSIKVVTTPTLAMSVDYLDAVCGVMITASHNPPEYIGIKLWNKHGLGFTPVQEKEIERIYQDRDFIQKKWNELGDITEFNDINKVHIEEVLKTVRPDAVKRTFSIIIDPGHGSSCEIAPLLLNKLKYRYLTLNSQPDGTFPGRLSEPNSKNLEDLSAFVSFTKEVELGIALDGDADRVVFIDGEGKYIEPIRTLAFLAREYIKEYFPDQKQRHDLVVITPLNSSGVIEHVLNPMGVKVIRTEIGDIKVSIQIKESNGLLGGENVGTYIWPQFHYGPDSLITIAMMLKYLSRYKQQFRDVIAEIPEFPFVRMQYDLADESKFRKSCYNIIAKDILPVLKDQGYSDLVEDYTDGVMLRFSEGWILIRKSGTSPVMRISAESKSSTEHSKKLIAIAEKIVKKHILMA